MEKVSCGFRQGLTSGALAVLLISSLPASTWGTSGFIGPEFQVNTHTTGSQTRPSVAAGPAGQFVVVWTGYGGSSGTDSDSTSIQGQRFASDGAPIGTEFQVNSYTTGYQVNSSVALGPQGEFVVVWSSAGSSGTDSDRSSIQGQRFGSDGMAVGTEFQVNAYTAGYQGYPSVAVSPAGAFVVVWDSLGRFCVTNADCPSSQACVMSRCPTQDGSARGLFGQRFGSDGAPAGTEFQVNTYTTGSQGGPLTEASVAVGPGGEFVVVWGSSGSSGTDSELTSIQGQRFGSGGAPVGAEFQVNTYTTSLQIRPSLAVSPSGEFVVVWDGAAPGGVVNVQGQRFDSDGAPIGTEFQVGTYAASRGNASVAFGPGGEFVVVAHSVGASGTDSSLLSIEGRRFGPDGVPNDTEFQINTYTTNDQRDPSVAAGPTGNFVVTWVSEGSSGTDGDAGSIQGQRLLGAVCDSAPEPDASCRLAELPAGAGKSSIAIKDKSEDTKDQLKWKWNKGVETGVADFNTPDLSTNAYTLCLYDAGGKLLEMELPAGGFVANCGKKPCWKAVGSGFKYKNKTEAPDGITDAKFKSGAAGKAQVQIKTKGKNGFYSSPATDALTPDVVIQLLIDDGQSRTCFKTSFANSGIKKQDGQNFKAKGP